MAGRRQKQLPIFARNPNAPGVELLNPGSETSAVPASSGSVGGPGTCHNPWHRCRTI